MIVENKLDILPECFYVGQKIDLEKFESISGNTNHLNKRIRAYVRDITVLYTIRTKKYSEEIQIIEVELNVPKIQKWDFRELIYSIQRGILYKTIIIFSYANKNFGQEYKVVVPLTHGGKKKEITVVDGYKESCWLWKKELADVFEKAKNICSGSNFDIRDVYNSIAEKTEEYPAEYNIYSEETSERDNCFNILSEILEDELDDVFYNMDYENIIFSPEWYDQKELLDDFEREDENDDDDDDDDDDQIDYSFYRTDKEWDKLVHKERYHKSKFLLSMIEEKETDLDCSEDEIFRAKEYLKDLNDDSIVEKYEEYLSDMEDVDFEEDEEYAGC